MQTNAPPSRVHELGPMAIMYIPPRSNQLVQRLHLHRKPDHTKPNNKEGDPAHCQKSVLSYSINAHTRLICVHPVEVRGNDCCLMPLCMRMLSASSRQGKRARRPWRWLELADVGRRWRWHERSEMRMQPGSSALGELPGSG